MSFNLLITLLTFAFIRGALAIPENVFLAVDGLSGGTLINRFPVANLWNQTNTNTSVNVNPAAFRKGPNELRTTLNLLPQDGSSILHLDDETGQRIFHLKFRTKWHPADAQKGEAEQHLTVVEWVKPELELQTFRLEPGEILHLTLPDEANPKPTFLKTKVPETPNPSVIVNLTYHRKSGTELPSPWLNSARYQTKDFLNVRAAAVEYVEALLSRDLERFTRACELKWQWESAITGRTISEIKATGKAAQNRYKIFEKRVISITKIDTFPETPIVKISGRQIGVQFDERPLYLQLYLLKTTNGWQVLQ